jgi:hypothetical protein
MDNDSDNAVDCEDASCAAGCQAMIDMACAGAVLGLASNMGNTMGGTNVFSSNCTGSEAPERIYSYTPPANGTLTVSLSSAADLGFYLRLTCNDKSSHYGCVDESPGGAVEQADLPVQGGVPLTIFVDGAGPGSAGAFTLTLTFTP